jgi:NADPH:quinone reductase-like Zn-dependent oxidoreductase
MAACAGGKRDWYRRLRRQGELARQLGCSHVINYNEEDVVAGVREITGGQGVPVVYDSVGKVLSRCR